MIDPVVPPVAGTARDQATAAWELRGTDPLAARDAATRALAASEGESDPIARARALAALGYAWYRLGFPDQSDATLAAAHAIALETADALATAWTLVAIGVLRRGQARYAEAVSNLRAAGDVYRRLDDAGGQAGVSINLALVFKNLGDPAHALELLFAAERGFRASSDRTGEAVALVNAVSVYRDLGDEAAALPMARRLCELTASLGSAVLEVNAQVALAGALAASGERVAALALAERAVALAEPTCVPSVVADALGTLGILLAESDPSRAEGLIAQAARVLDNTAEAWTVVSAQLALAEIQGRLGDLPRSLALARAAAELATAHGERGLAERAWRHAAQVSEALGDLPSAVAQWRDADRARAQGDADRRARGLILIEVNAAVSLARAEAEHSRNRVHELAAAARFRIDLMGMVAHDLRSPLTGAMMSVDLLTERVTTRADAQLIDDLGLALLRMKRIIEALCDDNADEQGAFAPNLADEDLLSLTTAIAREQEPFARKKHVVVRVEGQPTQVRCDAGRLAHALYNLISNAVKYTPPGTHVRVRLLNRPHVVRFEVEDEGPGIASSDFGLLFQPFGRGSAVPTGGERSTGLGLYIARRMVDLHGGTIGAEAGEVGARFWFEIPV